MTIYSGFFHEKWWFSIAMLNYQRVWCSISRSYPACGCGQQIPWMFFPLPASLSQHVPAKQVGRQIALPRSQTQEHHRLTSCDHISMSRMRYLVYWSLCAKLTYTYTILYWYWFTKLICGLLKFVYPCIIRVYPCLIFSVVCWSPAKRLKLELAQCMR